MNYLLCIGVSAIIILIFTRFLYDTFFKPNVIFSIIWLLGTFFISINIGGIKQIRNTTYQYILISVIMFNVGYFLLMREKNPKYEYDYLKFEFNNKTVENRIFKINSFLIIITLPFFIKMLLIWLTQSFYQVRVAAYVYSNIYEIIASRIVFWPMYAFFNIVLMLGTIKMFLGIKDYKLYLICFFDIFYFSVITGSRNFIAKFLLYFVAAFFIGNIYSTKKVKLNIKIIIISLIIVLILNAAIRARSLGKLSPLENVVVYLFGGISYFDNIIKIEDTSMLYGRGMFGWIVSPILYIISLTGLIPNYSAEYVIGEITMNGIYISDDFNFNALTTAMYPLYRDFGTYGIIIGMLLYGALIAIYEKKMYKKFNLKNFMLFFTFFITILESTQYYDMLFIRFSIQLILICSIFNINAPAKKEN